MMRGSVYAGSYRPTSIFPEAGGMRANVVTFPPGFGVQGVKLGTLRKAAVPL